MVKPDDVAADRARLTKVEDLLARLGAQYDLAMSAFKFDEAKELFVRIEAAERERGDLTERLPPPPPAPAAPRRRLRPLPRRRRRR